ncbi:hypothetical protein [Actinophytocola sediminis]
MAKKGGLLVAAAAMAIVLANTDDDGGGDPPPVDAIAGQFAASREAMLRGEATVAWSRIGMRAAPGDLRRRDPDCAAHAYGQVGRYLRRVPCQRLDRLLFTVDDKGGNTIAIAVAWVRFDTPAQAAEFKRIDDTWGTGQIRPLPGAELGLPAIRLSGQHYASRQVGALAVVAEAEEAAAGQLSDSFLDQIATVAALLPHR